MLRLAKLSLPPIFDWFGFLKLWKTSQVLIRIPHLFFSIQKKYLMHLINLRLGVCHDALRWHEFGIYFRIHRAPTRPGFCRLSWEVRPEQVTPLRSVFRIQVTDAKAPKSFIVFETIITTEKQKFYRALFIYIW